LLLDDDLGEDGTGDVFAGLGIIDDKVFAGLHHGGEVFERHVGARTGIVEPPVGVLFDRDRLFGLGDGLGHGTGLRGFAIKIGGFRGRGYRFVTWPARGAFRATGPIQRPDELGTPGIAAMLLPSVLSTARRLNMTYINEPAAIPRLITP